MQHRRSIQMQHNILKHKTVFNPLKWSRESVRMRRSSGGFETQRSAADPFNSENLVKMKTSGFPRKHRVLIKHVIFKGFGWSRYIYNHIYYIVYIISIKFNNHTYSYIGLIPTYRVITCYYHRSTMYHHVTSILYNNPNCRPGCQALLHAVDEL
jgi:hypothetical protein